MGTDLETMASWEIGMTQLNLRLCYLLALLVVLLIGAGAAMSAQSKAPAPTSVKPCVGSQLSLALDDEDGNFDGMSHSGTLFVLRNLGPGVCSLPARPMIGFEDAQQHPVPVVLEATTGMHPGPVLLPVAVPAGAELTSELRWVSGDVYDGGSCVAPAVLKLTLVTSVLRVNFSGRQMCGPAGKPVGYSMTPLRRDPVYALGS
jgi:hypothetical protein